MSFDQPIYPPITTRLLRLPEVINIVGLCRATIYNRMRDGTFPKAIPIGGRLVAWPSTDIDKWIDEQITAASDGLIHNDSH